MWDQKIDLQFTNHKPLIPTLLFNSEIAKMELSIFWIWGDLRFSWKFTFFAEITGDLRNFKFEEIWGGMATLFGYAVVNVQQNIVILFIPSTLTTLPFLSVTWFVIQVYSVVVKCCIHRHCYPTKNLDAAINIYILLVISIYVKYIEDWNLNFFKYTESYALWYMSSCKYFKLIIVFLSLNHWWRYK